MVSIFKANNLVSHFTFCNSPFSAIDFYNSLSSFLILFNQFWSKLFQFCYRINWPLANPFFLLDYLHLFSFNLLKFDLLPYGLFVFGHLAFELLAIGLYEFGLFSFYVVLVLQLLELRLLTFDLISFEPPKFNRISYDLYRGHRYFRSDRKWGGWKN